MYFDQRGGWLEGARYSLQAMAYPLHLATSSPSKAWQWVLQALQSRELLQAENARLRLAQIPLEQRLLRLDAVEQENAQLRQLKTALPALTSRWLAAEIINDDLSQLRQRLVINRGARAGVFKGQMVLGAAGLLGQILRVGPFSSEVILITDPEHGLPVQVLRTGLRSIAIGSGHDKIVLPYLPVQAEIEIGDQLVTSGLGGVFPAGYPVAKVTSVQRNGTGALATIEAEPSATMDRHRQVALLWFNQANPAASMQVVAP